MANWPTLTYQPANASAPLTQIGDADSIVVGAGVTTRATAAGLSLDPGAAVPITIGGTLASSITIGRAAQGASFRGTTTFGSGTTATISDAGLVVAGGGVNTGSVRAADGTAAITVASATGNVTLAANLTVNGNESVVGTSTFTGSEAFNGLATFGAGMAASGAAANDFSGGTGAFKTSTGAVTIGPGAVTVSGAATFSAAGTAIAVTNNVTIGGTLGVVGTTSHTGAVTFAGGVTASGATAIDFSGSTGAFKPSTGSFTWAGGAASALSLTAQATSLIKTAGAGTITVDGFGGVQLSANAVPIFDVGVSAPSTVSLSASAKISLGDVTASQLTSITTAVAVNGASGVITTQAASAASGTAQAFTLTNTAIAAGSSVVATLGDYSGTLGTNGSPIVYVNSIVGGSCQIQIYNAHAANALNGTFKIKFVVC